MSLWVCEWVSGRVSNRDNEIIGIQIYIVYSVSICF